MRCRVKERRFWRSGQQRGGKRRLDQALVCWTDSIHTDIVLQEKECRPMGLSQQRQGRLSDWTTDDIRKFSQSYKNACRVPRLRTAMQLMQDFFDRAKIKERRIKESCARYAIGLLRQANDNEGNLGGTTFAYDDGGRFNLNPAMTLREIQTAVRNARNAARRSKRGRKKR